MPNNSFCEPQGIWFQSTVPRPIFCFWVSQFRSLGVCDKCNLGPFLPEDLYQLHELTVSIIYIHLPADYFSFPYPKPKRKQWSQFATSLENQQAAFVEYLKWLSKRHQILQRDRRHHFSSQAIYNLINFIGKGRIIEYFGTDLWFCHISNSIGKKMEDPLTNKKYHT